MCNLCNSNALGQAGHGPRASCETRCLGSWGFFGAVLSLSQEAILPFHFSKCEMGLRYAEAHGAKALQVTVSALEQWVGQGLFQGSEVCVHFGSLLGRLLQLVPAYARSWKGATSSSLVEAPALPRAGTHCPIHENGLLPPPPDSPGAVGTSGYSPRSPHFQRAAHAGTLASFPAWPGELPWSIGPSLACSFQMSHKETFPSRALEEVARPALIP